MYNQESTSLCVYSMLRNSLRYVSFYPPFHIYIYYHLALSSEEDLLEVAKHKCNVTKLLPYSVLKISRLNFEILLFFKVEIRKLLEDGKTVPVL